MAAQTPAKQIPQELPKQLSQEMVDAARRLGEEYRVSGEIPDNDYIFWAVHDELHGARDPILEYFEGGVAERLRNVVEPHIPLDSIDMLDFAAGYSRVARHIPVVWPQARVTVSDVHEEAVAFARKIGFQAVRSTWEPEYFSLDERFDLIVAISFFTHMPEHVWARWLNALARHLKPGGMLLFTTTARRR